MRVMSHYICPSLGSEAINDDEGVAVHYWWKHSKRSRNLTRRPARVVSEEGDELLDGFWLLVCSRDLVDTFSSEAALSLCTLTTSLSFSRIVNILSARSSISKVPSQGGCKDRLTLSLDPITVSLQPIKTRLERSLVKSEEKVFIKNTLPV